MDFPPPLSRGRIADCFHVDTKFEEVSGVQLVDEAKMMGGARLVGRAQV